MKIALFGGTGFVGRYLTNGLLNHGYEPVLLVRPGSEPQVYRADECTVISGNIKERETIRKTIRGIGAIIYSIGIIRQFKREGITFEEAHFSGAKRCMDVASEVGVKRFILMSANGVRPDGTDYQKTKFMAEQYLRTTNLSWTIFRPSIIFGDPMGKIEFATQLRDQIIKIPVPAPLFYSGLLPLHAGKFEMSPVHVRNVADIFVKAVAMTRTQYKVYRLGGPDILNWKTMISIIGRATGKCKWTVPVPSIAFKSVAFFFDRFFFFPITRDQLTMLMEGNTCDSKEVFRLFSIMPIPFTVENLEYLKD